MDAQNLQKDPSVEVRPVWQRIWKLILQIREYTCADSTIKIGKKQPRKTERPKGLDGANQINKQITRYYWYSIPKKNLDILSWNYP